MGMIDLHMHSNVSDGTDSVPELLKQVEAAGIQAFSVTDHDTIDGALEMEKLVPEGIYFIKGIEFSCIAKGNKCHILGYGYDESDTEFAEVLAQSIAVRKNKLERRIAFLDSEYHITFTPEQLTSLRQAKSVGKPVVADYMVANGDAKNRDDAVENYINHCPEGRIEAGFAIRGILSAGGTPVWAHPLGGEKEDPLSEQEFYEQLQELIRLGIRGLECCYSRYHIDQIEMLLQYASRYNLIVTGGSDYHGSRKSGLQIGQLNADGLDMDTYINCSVL